MLYRAIAKALVAFSLFFVECHSQTTLKTPSEEPIIISNCPSDITRYVYRNEKITVTWETPTASGESVRPPSIMPEGLQPGQFFYLGNVTNAIYTFTDILENVATCEFTISIKDVICNLETEFQCNHNGRCIPLDFRCNGFSDCADSSDELECAIEPGCDELSAYYGLVTNGCFNIVPLQPFFKLDEPAWMFLLQSNQAHYLIRVDLNLLLLELVGVGGGSTYPSFNATIITSFGQRIYYTVDVHLSNAEGTSQIPLYLEPNEELALLLEYTPDIHNEPYQPVFFAPPCSECLQVVLVTNKYPDCSGNDFLTCMAGYYLFDEAEKTHPSGCKFLPPENTETFRSLFSQCLETVNIDHQGDLTIFGCPDVIKVIAPPMSSMVPVFWEEPVAFESLDRGFAGGEGGHFPGSKFSIGETEVSYAFFGAENQVEICAFTVVVESASCGEGEFLCNTGECIPWDYVCDAHSDCSDGSDVDAWYQGQNQCLNNGDTCQDVSDLHGNLSATCFDLWDLLAKSQLQNLPNGTIPWNLTNIYTNGVLLNVLADFSQLLEFLPQSQGDDRAPAFLINVKTSKSLLDENFIFALPTSDEGSGNNQDGFTYIYFRIPPNVQREDILVFVTYTPDFLNSVAPIPISYNFDCHYCIQVQVSLPIWDDCESFHYHSSGHKCVLNYQQWNKAESQNSQCEIQENAQEFRRLFGECADAISISEQDPFFVLGCPNDFSKRVPPTGGQVSWTQPSFVLTTGESVSPRYSHYSGNFFEVGMIEVSITATDSQNRSAECAFTVTTTAATCEENLFLCRNGRCIKAEYECDLFDDCGDNSDEESEACFEKFNICTDILSPRLNALNVHCPEPEPPSLQPDLDNFDDVGQQNGPAVVDVLKFKVPLDRDDIYLFGVDLQENIFGEFRIEGVYLNLNLDRYAFYIEVSTSKSDQYATALKVAQPFGKEARIRRQFDQQPSAFFRKPLQLRRGEEVHVRLRFTKDYLNEEPEEIKVCHLFCVSMWTVTFRPGCAGGFQSNCLQELTAWKTALMKSSDDVINQCTNPEADAVFEDLYEECYSAPEIEFVEPDQRGEPGSTVNLRCVAGGGPLPRVKWIRDSNEEVIANGTAAVGISVNVPEIEEIFRCEAENYLGKESAEVLVGPYSAECQDILQRQDKLYAENEPCSSSRFIVGSRGSPGQNFLKLDFPIFRLNPNAFVPAISFLGDSFKRFDPPFPAIQAVDLLIRKSIPRKRRRRAIEPILYSRRYEDVFLKPEYGNVTFTLDPPLSLLSLGLEEVGSFEVEITFSGGQVPDNQNVLVFVESFAHYVECPLQVPPDGLEQPQRKRRQDNGQGSEVCTDLYKDLSSLVLQADEDSCGFEDQRYRTLQRCLGEADAEPKVAIHPKSHQASLGQRASLNCYIENAVGYGWQKVSSDLPDQILQSVNSNTLFFSNFEASDQGMYTCIGYGGGAFQDQRVKSRPAVLTASGVSTFLMTVRFPDPFIEFDELMTGTFEGDPKRWLENRLHEDVFSDAKFYGVTIRGYEEGSIILKALLYYAGRNNDTDLALAIEAYFQEILSRPNYYEGYFYNSFYGIGLAEVDSLTVENIGSCPADVTPEPGGNVMTWPQTPINEVAESMEKCPAYTARAGLPRGTRRCSGDFISPPMWEQRVINDCFEGEDANDQLDVLTDTEVTMDNVAEVASDVAGLTNETDVITGDALVDIANILEDIADVGDSSEGVTNSVVETVNNVLEIDEEEFISTLDYNASTRIVRSLERQITNLQQQGQNFTDVRRNVGIRTVLLPMNSRSLSTGISFRSVSADDGILLADETAIIYDADDIIINEVEASITLPDQALNSARTNGGDMVPVSFFIYQNSKLFQSRRLIRESNESGENVRRIVGSRIIAATVEGAHVQGLPISDPVESAFLLVEDKKKTEDDVFENEECVFWDFSIGSGDWSNEGCQRVEVPGTNRIVCNCDHLTSFAVIVDVHGQKFQSLVLDLISKIGCAISIAALVFTIITYLLIKRLRQAQPQRILISLCFALLGLYAVFLAGIEATRSKYGCIVVAALLHYFTLASLLWMAVEAVNMYMLFVQVLNAHIHLFIFKASVVAWGSPIVVVAVVAGLDYTVYENERHCFMNIGNVFYFGQLLLIGLILLFNFIVFMIVTYKLTCGRRKSNRADIDKKKEAVKRLQNAICISVLLGLTWIAAFLTIIEGANFFFQVIFCIFNSLQGLFIFLLFCLRQNDVRRTWKKWLCCQGGADRRRSSAPLSSSLGTASSGPGQGTSNRGYVSDGGSIPMNTTGPY